MDPPPPRPQSPATCVPASWCVLASRTRSSAAASAVSAYRVKRRKAKTRSSLAAFLSILTPPDDLTTGLSQPCSFSPPKNHPQEVPRDCLGSSAHDQKLEIWSVAHSLYNHPLCKPKGDHHFELTCKRPWQKDGCLS